MKSVGYVPKTPSGTFRDYPIGISLRDRLNHRETLGDGFCQPAIYLSLKTSYTPKKMLSFFLFPKDNDDKSVDGMGVAYV